MLTQFLSQFGSHHVIDLLAELSAILEELEREEMTEEVLSCG